LLGVEPMTSDFRCQSCYRIYTVSLFVLLIGTAVAGLSLALPKWSDQEVS